MLGARARVLRGTGGTAALYDFTKRAVDVIICVVALPVVLGVLTVLMAAVMIESPGASPIFRQRRLGLDGKQFWLLKLRTMVPRAERMRADLEHMNEARPPLFKMRRDPRITRIGRFLRSSSLDELPQVLNVLAGQMTLVGPRPRLPQEFDLTDPRQLRRFSVKPGLAGLWQVSGRAKIGDFERALEIDLFYVDHRSLRYDVELLLRTFVVVLAREGAY